MSPQRRRRVGKVINVCRSFAYFSGCFANRPFRERHVTANCLTIPTCSRGDAVASFTPSHAQYRQYETNCKTNARRAYSPPEIFVARIADRISASRLLEYRYVYNVPGRSVTRKEEREREREGRKGQIKSPPHEALAFPISKMVLPCFSMVSSQASRFSLLWKIRTRDREGCLASRETFSDTSRLLSATTSGRFPNREQRATRQDELVA